MPEAPTPAEETPIAAYAVVLVIYVALGFLFKSVFLNWIVGPIFPVVMLYLLPKALGRTR